jgi:hypothetical protein
MPVKTLRHPVSGNTFKLGRKRPVARCPRFALKNYLTRNMPAPPATLDYIQKAEAALTKIYDNDTLGDCVIAGMAHVVGVGYTAAGITIDTWGMTGTMTNAAVAKYPTQASGGELYTVVSVDAISAANQKAPNGFDWSQLVADFDSMGGSVSAVLQQQKASRAGA